MLQPYPTDFPAYAIGVILDKIKNPESPTNPIEGVVHSAWELIGWGLGQALPDGPKISGDPAGELLKSDYTDAEMVSLLESVQNSVASQGPQVYGVIPWILIVSIAIQILQRYMKKRG